MEVIPAIDLRGGRCVRLYQGDYDRETVFDEDPVSVAVRWANLGAGRLHVVDLDGARDGAPANLEVVQKIVSSVSVPVQLGGGIRDLETVRSVLSLGVARVIVGTTAVENPGVVRSICSEVGDESLVVSVDARDGYVAVRGWKQQSRVPASDLVSAMAEVGVSRFMYTDIGRDGTLTEPNFQAIEGLLAETGATLIAAGGIASVDHLQRLDALGVEAAVVGSALYTGDIDFAEALEALR